ncbi:MAG: HAD hydrolase family protein [Anaerolineae bacterium]
MIDFETYSFAETETAVHQLIARHIPLVLCSSKTKAEQAYYRQALGIPDPFIVENGSAIFVPKGYFPFAVDYQRTGPEFDIIELGLPAAQIRQIFLQVRQETGLTLQSFTDLTVAEVSRITGLDEAAAQNAQTRDYSETIVTPLTAVIRQQLQTAFAAHDLALISGGKFHTLTSMRSDKGTAVTILTTLFRRQLGLIVTVGLGDSANDRPLLAAVERPYLVQKPNGRWQKMNDLAITKVPGIGPDGWQQVISKLLQTHATHR